MFQHAKRMTLVAVMASMVPLVSLGAASPPAVAAAPGGIFSVFADCPLAAFRAAGVPPDYAECAFHQITSGEVAIGSMVVPIDQTITLQGGFTHTGNPENEAEYFEIPPEGGESISKTELNVPGGLPGLIDCREINGWGLQERVERDRCRAFSFNGRTTGVTATAEIVANVESPPIYNEFALVREEGTALTLPVRVHLKNPFLGDSCYIGSEAHPLELHLTTGATSLTSPPKGWKSIHGTLGEIREETEKELSVLLLVGDSLVDNTFSAPGAEGCGEVFGTKGVLDSALDAKVKIPNNPGENTAILTGIAKATEPANLEALEKIQETETKKQQEEAEAKRKQEEAEAEKRQEEHETKRQHWGHWPHWHTQPARGNGDR